jgi:uncharacterized delta-60 repeat protein
MKNILLYFVLLFSATTTIAQNPTDVVKTYGAFPGFNDKVRDIALQPDGKIIYVGSFTKYRGNICNRIVRINSDGTIDPTFLIGTGFSDFANVVTLQPDGKILVGGVFFNYQAVTRPKLIRLNTDGSIDSSFVVSNTFNFYTNNSWVEDVLMQPDGKILLGGGFTYGIARINSDGSPDNDFAIGSGFNLSVYSLALQIDGKILAGGSFTTFNGVNRNNIIRLNTNGSKDDSFSIGIGFNGKVNDVAIQADGKVLICGDFSTYKGITQKKIVRLLTDGAVDAAFDIGTSFANATSIYDPQSPEKIALDANGNVMIAGSFTSFNGTTKQGFLKLLTNGSIDLSSDFISKNYLHCIEIGSDGKIVVGGDTYTYRIFANGSQDPSLNNGSGFNDTVNTILQQADGKYIVGGNFTKYQNETHNALTRFNADGTTDTTFNFGSGLVYGSIYTSLLLPDGKLIIGGNFSYNYNGNYLQNLLKLNADGSIDNTFTVTPINGPVESLALQSDGKVLIGGNFTEFNGTLDTYLMRINPNGIRDVSFDQGAGFNTEGFGLGVNSIVIQPDGKILVAGEFTIYQNEPHYRILRLWPNGSVDSTFMTGDGFNGTINKIILLADGKIIAAGNVGSYDSQSVWGIARLHNDGSLDTTFSTGFTTNGILDAILQPDGKIVTGGFSTYFVGNQLPNFVRFNSDGSIDDTFNPEFGFNSYSIKTLSLFANGNILVGGNFYNFNGYDSSSLIMLRGGLGSLSTSNFTSDEFFIYPNPVKEVLHLSLPMVTADFTYSITFQLFLLKC